LRHTGFLAAEKETRFQPEGVPLQLLASNRVSDIWRETRFPTLGKIPGVVREKKTRSLPENVPLRSWRETGLLWFAEKPGL
jgi:hypothetical protein